MPVLIASEAHFHQAADGATYAGGPENYAFWSSYRDVLGPVSVLARVGAVENAGAGKSRADGDGVSFIPLEDYSGPWQYLASLGRLRKRVGRAMDDSEVCLLRAPGAVAYLAWDEIRRRRRPYGVEVLGDPWDSLGPRRGAGSEYAWRGVARRWSADRLRRLCREAPLACYVTRSRLQQRYPPGKAAFSCSDVRVDCVASEHDMQQRLRRIGRQPWRLGFLGSLERLYKAPDVHLAAVAMCRARGINLRFTLAGEGRHRPAMERLAGQLGIVDVVCLPGAISPVADFLDSIDLFLIASYCEGLPRALVEAMARGCPAIGSRAGGIPELLGPDELVQPGSAESLACKIAELLQNPARLIALARRNHTMAQAFTRDRLDPLRREFLLELRRLGSP